MPDGSPSEEKIAAIGIRLRRWVSFHGLTSLCIVEGDADLPPPDGLSAPLPPAALGLAGLRLGGDGDDGADPVADRAARSTRSRRRRASRDLLPLALAIVGAAILRLGLTVVRRLVAGKVSLAVEFDLRQRFYAHLQRLELGFFDCQQTGQLMSRATVDLQSIRFFLGYGLIFITQNLLTIVLAARGDGRDQPAGWR